MAVGRAIAAMNAAQRSGQSGQGRNSSYSPVYDQDLIDTLNSPRVELQPRENFPRNPLAPDGWWDHTDKFFERRDAETEARNIATDVARGFTPTTRMPSGGGTTATEQPTKPTGPTGPRGGGSEGQRTRPPAPASPVGPTLSQIVQQLALSPYQGIGVTGRTRRPTPEIPLRGEDAFGRFLENLVTNVPNDIAGFFGVGPNRPQYDYTTEHMFKSPIAEIAHNSYNPYGVLFNDPIMTDSAPYYQARPEMIPRWSSGRRYGTWQGY